MVARREQIPRAVVRAAEVAREFASWQDQVDDEYLWQARYLPPWRSYGPDQELGPWEGPMSLDTFRAQERRWAQSIDAVAVGGAGGGLWDYEAHIANGALPQRPLRSPERYDAEVMSAFIGKHGRTLARRELEVYVLFWLERLSFTSVADRIGIARDTVRGLVKSLRRQAAGG